MKEYQKSETLEWLHKLEQQLRDYRSKITNTKEDNSVMNRYYGMKLERACKELEIPMITLSQKNSASAVFQDAVSKCQDTYLEDTFYFSQVKGV